MKRTTIAFALLGLLILLSVAGMNVNAQKISSLTPKYTPLEVQLFDCKKAYIKLSDERDSLKNMHADSLLSFDFQRIAWGKKSKTTVKETKKTWFGRGVLVTLGLEAVIVYLATR